MAKKVEAETMKVEEFLLANPDKLRRAIEGSNTQKGELVGGVGADASPEEIRAAYDKIGGLILKNGRKVKTGAFWDFKGNKARKEPEVIFEHRSASGELFEYKGEVEPLEVTAEKSSRARKAKADKEAEE